MESPNHLDRKKARQVESKAKSMPITFFDVKGIVHKEFVLAGRTVRSTYYCDILQRLCEIVRRLRPELWQQNNWLLHHDNAPSHTSFFTREFFTKSKMTVIPNLFYFSLFLRLKIKLRVRHFDITEVIKAESQAVLNILTEHDFQDAFKKWQKSRKWCIHTEGDYFKRDGGQ
jgi:hypothetical protein